MDEYLDKLLQITAELKRVLKPTGTLWWNHSDCYGGSGHGTNDYRTDASKSIQGIGKNANLYKTGGIARGLMPKCLVLQNSRLVIRMIDEQGWILRNTIIWHKTNSMPSSVKGRFTNTYEPVFYFVKQTETQYYYNTKTGFMANRQPREPQEGIDWEWRECPNCKGTGRIKEGICKRCGDTGKIKHNFWRGLSSWFDLDSVREPHAEASLERLNIKAIKNYQSSIFSPKRLKETDMITKRKRKMYGRPEVAGQVRDNHDIHDCYNIGGKNPGDIWTFSTQPFSQAHFATFPEEFVRRCLLPGCPKEICNKCGKARIRISKTGYDIDNKKKPQTEPKYGRYPQRGEQFAHGYSKHQTLGWTDCQCGARFHPGLVLDPFCGAGTVPFVAKKYGYLYCGLELNPDYVAMSEKRLKSISECLI